MSTQQGSLSRQAFVRLQGGDLLLRVFDNEEIMEILEVSLASVKRWRKKVESDGLPALARKPGSGSEAELSPKQLDELKTILAKGAIAAGYQTERWTSRIVADLIRKKWNVDYCGSNVRRILNDLGYSYQKPSVKLTKHSQDVVDHWRKHDWKRIKKADKNGWTLTIWDESGFSFVPNRNHTWAPVGETPVLRETPGRHNHTGLGYITRTPRRHLLKFRFTIFKGAACTEDLVFHLTELHYYYGGAKILVLWDHLPGHHGAETYFVEHHPDWFEFEYFPTHSPELNPVESCWNKMKNEYLPNFVPTSDEQLVVAVLEAAMKINEEKKIYTCFKTAGIPP